MSRSVDERASRPPSPVWCHGDVRTSALPVTLTAAVSALALAACTGSADDPASDPAAPATSSAAPSSPATPATATTSRISGAPAGLRDVVTARYGSAVTGSAERGRWRGDAVAVVTGSGDQDGDVTLAVRPRGRQGWKVVGGWWPSLGLTKGKTQLGGRGHVLLIGSDARPGEDPARTRADALQLLGVDGTGGAGLMGFARDLWVPIPGHGEGKLNSALVYGGPQGQVDTVRRLTGIRPRGYVLTGFEGFEGVVDDLGGLSFRAPFSMDSHLSGGTIAKGARRLSGRQALAWSRERKSLPGGDFDRSRNQGLLLAAAAIQARLAGPAVLPRALTVVDRHTESDLTGEEMLLFAAAFYRVDPGQVGRAVAKGPTGTAAGQSVVRLDDASRAAFRDFRDGRISG